MYFLCYLNQYALSLISVSEVRRIRLSRFICRKVIPDIPLSFCSGIRSMLLLQVRASMRMIQLMHI